MDEGKRITSEEECEERKRRSEWQASITPEERLQIFSGQSFLTKEQVIDDILKEISDVDASIQSSPENQRQYLCALCDFLNHFVGEIQRTVLFERLEPWWAYRYILSSRGATLELMHMQSDKTVILPEGGYFSIPDTTFPVVQLNAKTMTIEEYAKYTGKTEASIRQGLRRGKYRSAFKMGQEWRISELCQPNIERGYVHGSYEWHTTLSGVPDGFEYIREPGFVDINQDSENKQSFQVYVHKQGEVGGSFYLLDQVDMERLELFLIANPLVIFRDDEKIYDKRRTE